MNLFDLIAVIALLICTSFSTYLGYKIIKDTDDRYK